MINIQTLEIIETKGLVGSVEAADVMVKVVNVTSTQIGRASCRERV